MMKKTSLIALVLTGLLLTACREHIDIQGVTSLYELEGRMLYLRVYHSGELISIDSARIQHGKFHFKGEACDSSVMANLFLGDESVMPIVLDGQPLKVTLNENERKVEGSELNDSLFAFIRRKALLESQIAELPRRESQMILSGIDHDEILARLNEEASRLGAQNDALVMRFIKDNMANVLAPGVFMIVTSGFPYSVLNPQIEELVTLASETFLNDEYVRDYLKMARENMDKMNE